MQDDLRVEGELPRMWVLGGSIGDDHLCQRQAVNNRSYFTVIIVSDGRKCNPFSLSKC